MSQTANQKTQDRSGSRSALSWNRRIYDGGLRALLWICAGVTCALLLFLIGYIFYRGVPNLSWEFLTTKESLLKGTMGILPAIQNTLYVVVVTLAIALPLGVGAAVYLTEYATNGPVVEGIEFAAETLSGIPSILYALVGYLAFSKTLGLGYSLLAASLTLAMMNLPTIIRTTQESLKTVPRSYREGALGLGSGKWHMIRTIVLPGSIDGIVTGCILSVGRIVGESAVLLYVGGMGNSMNDFFASADQFIHSSGATLTVALYVFAKERAILDPAFGTAVVLLGFTLIINLSAKVVGRKLKQRQA
ncbi:MAG: phosphate ABC transporter permease PstA [Lawsonibacter sp.]